MKATTYFLFDGPTHEKLEKLMIQLHPCEDDVFVMDLYHMYIYYFVIVTIGCHGH